MKNEPQIRKGNIVRETRTLEQLRAKLVPGRTYRRSDLAQYSSSIDRHLVLLRQQGLLRKVSHGLYSVPKNTALSSLAEIKAEAKKAKITPKMAMNASLKTQKDVRRKRKTTRR